MRLVQGLRRVLCLVISKLMWGMILLLGLATILLVTVIATAIYSGISCGILMTIWGCGIALMYLPGPAAFALGGLSLLILQRLNPRKLCRGYRFLDIYEDMIEVPKDVTSWILERLNQVGEIIQKLLDKPPSQTDQL